MCLAVTLLANSGRSGIVQRQTLLLGRLTSSVNQIAVIV